MALSFSLSKSARSVPITLNLPPWILDLKRMYRRCGWRIPICAVFSLCSREEESEFEWRNMVSVELALGGREKGRTECSNDICFF